MRLQLRSGNLSLGRVDLEGSPLAAGFLQPTLAYDRVLGQRLRFACAQIAQRGFPKDGIEPADLDRGLQEALRAVVLCTEEGVPCPTSELSLWDEGRAGVQPFVVASFDPDGPTAGASIARRPHRPQAPALFPQTFSPRAA